MMLDYEGNFHATRMLLKGCPVGVIAILANILGHPFKLR
jgi:hypothetical protein